MVQKIKKELRTFRGKVILAISIIFLSGVILFSLGTWTQAKPMENKVRIIELQIKDMAFGSNNPDIFISPGETVQFVITNLDPGMVHDFKIKGTNIQTRDLKFGEQDTVTYKAPLGESTLTYVCTWHALSMTGNLLVRVDFPAPSNIALN